MKRKKQREIEAIIADHERWDNRELGLSDRHIRMLSDTEQATLDKEIDKGLGLHHISIRLSKKLIEKLKLLSQLEGIGYQPLIRALLTRYVKENEYRLDTVRTAIDAADKADKLFSEAMDLRQKINKLPQLSAARVSAETRYSRALRQAQGLFDKTIDATTDPVLLQHASLRLAQIAKICQNGGPNRMGRKKRAADKSSDKPRRDRAPKA